MEAYIQHRLVSVIFKTELLFTRYTKVPYQHNLVITGIFYPLMKLPNDRVMEGAAYIQRRLLFVINNTSEYCIRIIITDDNGVLNFKQVFFV